MKKFIVLILLFAFLTSFASAEESSILVYESGRDNVLRFTDCFGDEILLTLSPSQTAPALRTGRSYRVVMNDGGFVSAEEVQPKTVIGVFVDQAMHSAAFWGPRGELISFFRQISPGIMAFEGEFVEGHPYRLTYMDEKLLYMEEVPLNTANGILTEIAPDSVEIEIGGERFRFEAVWDAEAVIALTPGSAVSVAYAGDRLLSLSAAEN